jgi:isochorismate synthase
VNGLAWIREAGQEAQAWELEPSAGGNFGVAPFRGPIQRFEALDRGQGAKGRAWMAAALGALELPNLKPTDSHAASDYVQLVEQARQACADGVLEKVVLSRRKAYHRSRVQPWEAFERLAEAYPHATVFLIQTPGGSLWMGATPECLTEVQGANVRTMSLAGTRLRGSQGAWGLKEREEQHVVTKDIVQMLQALGVDQVQVEGPSVLEAGPVEHLCSHIEGRAAGLSAWDIAGALHPTPAVGGLPRAQAQAFIRRHEGYDRRNYAGYFGWTSAERSIFYVTLRCVEWGSDGFLGYAGGGITAKSDPVGEWAETEQKLQTLENVLLG